MKGTYAVLWALHGRVHSGALEAFRDRIELRTRGRTFSIPLASVEQFAIERGASVRINGLAVLTIALVDGDVLRIASLQGTGVLHELVMHLSPAVAAAG